MKFCYAMSSGPMSIRTLSNIEIVVYMTALSVEYLHLLSQKAVLYGDGASINLLNAIEWDEVYEIAVDRDTFPDTAYAAAKIYALEKMSIDDIYIDFDVFIKRQRCINQLQNIKCDLLTQYEYFADTDKFSALLNATQYLNSLGITKVADPLSVKGYNSGLIKFGNEKLKAQYIELYKSFYKVHKDTLDINKEDDLILDTYVEEHGLFTIGNQVDQEGKLLFDSRTLIGSIDKNVNFGPVQQLAAEYGYEHLCGQKLNFLPKIKAELGNLNRQKYNQINETLASLSGLLINKYLNE